MRRRAWRGWDDLPRMQALLSRALRDDPRAFLHPGDLAWWVGWPPKTPAALADAITVWEDDDRILAWVMVDDDDVGECVGQDVDRADDPRPDMVARIAAHPGATRYVRADDESGVRRLREAGYMPVEGGAMAGFSLRMEDLGWIEPDARVVPVATGDDLAPRASITREAFNVERPLERYTQEYLAFTGSPAYPRGWDLVAWADGEAVACAIVWPDPISGVGNVEPVATRPGRHRRGFATAVLREGLRRLRDAGMTRAIVRTPSTNEAAVALYRSVGFVDDHTQVAFRLP